MFGGPDFGADCDEGFLLFGLRRFGFGIGRILPLLGLLRFLGFQFLFLLGMRGMRLLFLRNGKSKISTVRMLFASEKTEEETRKKENGRDLRRRSLPPFAAQKIQTEEKDGRQKKCLHGQMLQTR